MAPSVHDAWQIGFVVELEVGVRHASIAQQQRTDVAIADRMRARFFERHPALGCKADMAMRIDQAGQHEPVGSDRVTIGRPVEGDASVDDEELADVGSGQDGGSDAERRWRRAQRGLGPAGP
jgi:hypothetical protein